MITALRQVCLVGVGVVLFACATTPGTRVDFEASEPASSYHARGILRKPEGEFSLEIYPDAHHCFDFPGLHGVTTGKGAWEYNRAAAEDAVVRVREFLAKYLGTRWWPRAPWSRSSQRT